jgi:hypothetical protein
MPLCPTLRDLRVSGASLSMMILLLRQECSAQMSLGPKKNLEASGFLSPGLPTLIFDLSNFSDLSNFRPRQ